MRGRRAPRSFLRLGTVGTVRGVALLITTVLLASSCTGSFEDFERAVELAMEKGTARMESTTILGGIPGPEGEEAELRFVVAGAFDLPADVGELTMTVDLTPPPPPGEPMPVPCRMVFEGEETVYLKDARGPGWLRTPLFPPEEAEQPGATDPREAFELLKAVFGDVDAIGREEVRGVQTTHWKVFVDVDRVLAELGEAPEGGFLASLTQQKFPMDVWIDPDGLPRRIAYSLRDQTPEGPVEMESTTDIFDYGEPLAIEVPPPAEVREEPDPDRAMDACIGMPME